MMQRRMHRCSRVRKQRLMPLEHRFLQSSLGTGLASLGASGSPLILPLAHGHVLQIGSQGNLRRRHSTGGCVLKHLLSADPRAFGILAGGHQRKGNVRRGVDGQTGVGVGIGHVGNVGQQTAGHSVQLVLIHRQHIAVNAFTGGKRSLSPGAFLALPRDGKRSIRKSNGCLVDVDYWSNDQLTCGSSPVGLEGVGIHIPNLGTRLVGAKVCRQAFAVGQVNDCFRTGCNNGHG